jgi:hypothetical protein
VTTNTDKPVQKGRPDKESPRDKDCGSGTTTKLSRKGFIEGIPVKQRACLEIIGFGEESRMIELQQGEVVIGRNPECGIQLSSTNVSREHARVVFRNEEYHIEDLDSTNGTYVNGIRVVKCVLRNDDQIDIGGVKMLFTEEKILENI